MNACGAHIKPKPFDMIFEKQGNWWALVDDLRTAELESVLVLSL